MKIKNENIIKLFFLTIISLLLLMPLYIPIVNSVKALKDLYISPFSIPKIADIIWSNFSNAWIKGNLFRYFLNSLTVTTISVLLLIFLSSMVGFALTRKNSLTRLNKILFLFFLMGIMIPPQVSIIPLYFQMKFFHISNTLFGLIIAFIAYNISFSIFIMYSFIKNIPDDIEDAAIIDGCSNFQLYSKIILPLSRSPIIAVTIFTGVAIWNNLLFPLVLITSSNKKTLPIGLLGFTGRWQSDYPIMFAGVIIVSIPLIVAYLVMQNKFVEGLTAGSLKG